MRPDNIHPFNLVKLVIPPRANSTGRFLPISRLSTASSAPPESKQNQTISLPDGRELGFAEYGDPTGRPLFYLHGWPSSRFEARDLDTIARGKYIRVIAPERPGFGLSTFAPKKILDYPKDISHLAKHLDIPQYKVLGISGGEPFALACAYVMPQSEVTGIGMAGSGGPWRVYPENGNDQYKMLSRDVMWSQWILFQLINHVPGITESVFNGSLGLAKSFVESTRGSAMIDGWLKRTIESLKQKEKEGIIEKSGKEWEDDKPEDIPAIRKRLIVSFSEAFTSGSAGALHEARLLTSYWGFRFEDAPREGIRIWHGTKDDNAPIVQIRYMTERIPGCMYTEYPDLNHYELGSKIGEILDEIMEDEVESPASARDRIRE